jgi:hypothetical protein
LLCEVDHRRRGLLRLLRETLQGQQNLTKTTFEREQNSVDAVLAGRTNLPDLTPEMPRPPYTESRHFIHGIDNDRPVYL